MTMIPIPADEVKRNTWYYGVQCACERFLALGEDCFAGKSDERVLHVSEAFKILCECGAVTAAQVLHKCKTL
jgi:hypothetical protein